jgi:hypothetical protein
MSAAGCEVTCLWAARNKDVVCVGTNGACLSMQPGHTCASDQCYALLLHAWQATPFAWCCIVALQCAQRTRLTAALLRLLRLYVCCAQRTCWWPRMHTTACLTVSSLACVCSDMPVLSVSHITYHVAVASLVCAQRTCWCPRMPSRSLTLAWPGRYARARHTQTMCPLAGEPAAALLTPSLAVSCSWSNRLIDTCNAV